MPENLTKPTTLPNKNSNGSPLLAPHAYSAQQITGLLNIDAEQGLSNEEAATRLVRDGANTLETAAGRS